MAVERKTYIQSHRQSSIGTCLHCKRAYMFRYRWCIFPGQRPFAEAANQGSIVHRLLQVGPDRIEEVKQAIFERVSVLEDQIEKGEDLLGYFAVEASKLLRQFDKAVAMVTLLWERYPRPDYLKVLAQEKDVTTTFRLGMPDNTSLHIELSGILDEIDIDERTGHIYIRDYKSSGRDIEYTLTGYLYSLQCRIYRLLAGAYLQGIEEYKGRSPEGFILEYLRVPSIIFGDKDKDYTEHEHTFTRGARKGQVEIRRKYEGVPTFENYLKRCKEWYEKEGVEAVQSFSIRFNEPVMPPELFTDLCLTAVYQTIPAVPANFPRDETTSHCKFMQKVCPYYKLCSSDEGMWDAIIETEFRVSPPKNAKETPSDKEPEVIVPEEKQIIIP